MGVRYLNRINPEAECILLLERRFQPDAEAPHNIEQIRAHLSEKYDIPMFELNPLLQPLQEVESYVNSNLSVSEKRLRFFFTLRSNGPASLAWPLYSALKAGVRCSGLPEAQKLQALRPTLRRVLDVPQDGEDTFDHVVSLEDLMGYLLQSGCTEDVKWVCTALYYSMDEYLEELDVILRKATGLFLEHLPDVSALCNRTAAYAQERIGDEPARAFSNLKFSRKSDQVTVVPCLMGFHGLRWDFEESRLDFGVYYEAITNLIEKYSDQSASLVSRLKSIGDKSRLEIFKVLKNGDCNGQDLAEKLGLAPATISHHMNLLSNEGFVLASRRGTSIYYSLNRNNLHRFLQELEHCLL